MQMLCKVVKTDRLISLGRNMKAIRAIYIGNANVCPHLVDYQLNKFKVAMIRCEV